MTTPLPVYLLDALDKVFDQVREEDCDPVIPAIKAYAAECVAAGRERCASLLNITRAEASLACGDMTEQEWRTVSAVLAWRQRVIKEQTK